MWEGKGKKEKIDNAGQNERETHTSTLHTCIFQFYVNFRLLALGVNGDNELIGTTQHVVLRWRCGGRHRWGGGGREGGKGKLK